MFKSSVLRSLGLLLVLTSCFNPAGGNPPGMVIPPGDEEPVDGTIPGDDTPPAGSLTVTFNGNGAETGQAPAPVFAAPGTSIVLPDEGTLTKEGPLVSTGFSSIQTYLVFTGWNTAVDGSGVNYSSGTSFTVNQAITLYGRWAESSAVRKLSFRITTTQGADSEINVEMPTPYLEGDAVPLPTLTQVLSAWGGSYEVPGGKSFGGWQLFATDEIYQPGTSDSFTLGSASPLFLLVLNDAPLPVTLNYNGGDDSEAPVLAFTKDSPLSGLPLPTRSGLSFAGWYEGAARFENGDFMPDRALTLEARWVAVLSFDSAGAEEVEAQELEPGSSGSEPAAPTREGYRFDGWFVDAQATSPWDFSTAVTVNRTLVARWSARPEVQDITVVSFQDDITLKVRYRSPDGIRLSGQWLVPQLDLDTDYTVEEGTDETSGPLIYQVSLIRFHRLSFAAAGAYSQTLRFSLSHNDETAEATYDLSIPANRAPTIREIPILWERSEPNALLINLYVWDYETPGTELTVLVSSSNPNVLLGGSSSFSPPHAASIGFMGVPVVSSQRDVALLLNGPGPLTTDLTVTVTDEDGIQTAQVFSLTIN